ncbi:TPA: glycoside hydrolase family 1 protein [Candidatus Bathyarchaeota archaeon]|nr:glycoside hydrolase family 1 protein [Candidatus Bathyarchaeota archaeon]
MVFPENFLWGVSISGFQFEMGDPGGRNVDPNTDWYVWVHDPRNVERGIVSGDLPEKGVDYWDLFRKDHEMAESLGLNAYRLGTEWSRIFPESTSAVEVGVDRSPDGHIARIDVDDSALERLDGLARREALDHYRDVITDLRARGFEVFVCLNHFTLPLWVHDPIVARDTGLRRGPKGWLEEGTAIEFSKYAAYMAWKLGDVVDRWATFNEPMVVPETGYGMPEAGFPPGVSSFKALRRASVHMAIAHARAYDAIKEWDTVRADEDSPVPAGVGVIHNVIPVRPLEPERELDVRAAEFLNRLHNHFFIQCAVTGWLDENFNGRKERGEAKAYMGRRLDWLGVNYYTRAVVRGRRSLLARLFAGVAVIPDMVRGYGFSCEPRGASNDGLATSDFGWEVYPQGIVEALRAMRGYGRPMYITENGIADADDRLRPLYIASHLKALDRAINEERTDLRGYLHWALTDNYEWAKGFTMRFGLCAVDLQTKRRVPRRSATTFRRIIEAGQVTGEMEEGAI